MRVTLLLIMRNAIVAPNSAIQFKYLGKFGPEIVDITISSKMEAVLLPVINPQLNINR